MATGQGNPAAATEKLTMGNPPPYSPPSQQQLQQMPTPQREYIQFIQHNPQGFVLQQQPDQPQTEWFSDISDGYCYDQSMSQQMPPGQMTSTQSTVMVNQPQQEPMMVVNEAPYNYMLPAILSCLFCFLPLGLIAIVAAYKSKSEAAQMRFEDARRSASKAKSYSIAAFLCGIVVMIIGPMIIIIAVITNKTRDTS